MSDMQPDNTILAWLAALAAGALSWFARGIGVGRKWGEVETKLGVMHDQLRRIEAWQIEHTKADSQAVGMIGQRFRELGEKVANLQGRFAESKERD